MIEQRARVVGTEAGFALVEAAPSGGCGTCGVQGGCGVSKLGRLLPRRSRVLRVTNELGARPGDEVTLGVAEDACSAARSARKTCGPCSGPAAACCSGLPPRACCPGEGRRAMRRAWCRAAPTRCRWSGTAPNPIHPFLDRETP